MSTVVISSWRIKPVMSNEEAFLKATDVPASVAAWSEITDFALTLNG